MILLNKSTLFQKFGKQLKIEYIVAKKGGNKKKGIERNWKRRGQHTNDKENLQSNFATKNDERKMKVLGRENVYLL